MLTACASLTGGSAEIGEHLRSHLDRELEPALAVCVGS